MVSGRQHAGFVQQCPKCCQYNNLHAKRRSEDIFEPHGNKTDSAIVKQCIFIGWDIAASTTGHVHEKKALNMTAVFYQTARVQV